MKTIVLNEISLLAEAMKFVVENIKREDLLAWFYQDNKENTEYVKIIWGTDVKRKFKYHSCEQELIDHLWLENKGLNERGYNLIGWRLFRKSKNTTSTCYEIIGEGGNPFEIEEFNQ